MEYNEGLVVDDNIKEDLFNVVKQINRPLKPNLARVSIEQSLDQ